MTDIKIDIKLFVTLAAYAPENAGNYTVQASTTVEMLIKELNIPEDTVKLIFVNGRKQDASYMLQSGDRVGLFPPVGGG
ncbi:MAG TPA: MoaD/ThiS family protein [Desulfotignum sp.]|nr:MoaD/ThiS family protein [Desulfotignum sp.]